MMLAQEKNVRHLSQIDSRLPMSINTVCTPTKDASRSQPAATINWNMGKNLRHAAAHNGRHVDAGAVLEQIVLGDIYRFLLNDGCRPWDLLWKRPEWDGNPSEATDFF